MIHDDERPPWALPGESSLAGSTDCWCGRGISHDWEGKSEGAPHPRPARDIPGRLR